MAPTQQPTHHPLPTLEKERSLSADCYDCSCPDCVCIVLYLQPTAFVPNSECEDQGTSLASQVLPTLVEYLIRNRQAAAATRLITPIRSSSPTLVMSSIGISIWPVLSDQVKPDTPSIAHKKKAIIIPAMLKPYTLLETEKILNWQWTNCKKPSVKLSCYKNCRKDNVLLNVKLSSGVRYLGSAISPGLITAFD